MMQVLYNKDCVSDQAIIYWAQKGAKPQGKQHFLKATETLVKVKLVIQYLFVMLNVPIVPTAAGRFGRGVSSEALCSIVQSCS